MNKVILATGSNSSYLSKIHGYLDSIDVNSNFDKNFLVYFGGRLAEYKYYDMDDVIESALNKVKSILDEQKDGMP